MKVCGHNLSVRSQLACVYFLVAIGMSSVFSACSSSTSGTNNQRQIVQSRFFSGISVADLTLVVETMLKDSGYQVTQVTPDKGVVVGTLKSQEPLRFTTRFGQDSYRSVRQGERLEAVFNLSLVDNENVAVRVSLQRIPEYSLGVIRGEEISDPKKYERLFAQLQSHVKKWFRSRKQSGAAASPPSTPTESNESKIPN